MSERCVDCEARSFQGITPHNCRECDLKARSKKKGMIEAIPEACYGWDPADKEVHLISPRYICQIMPSHSDPELCLVVMCTGYRLHVKQSAEAVSALVAADHRG